MLERLLEQCRVIMDISLTQKLQKKKNDSDMLFKDHEWEMLSDMSNVSKNFSEITIYMCSEKYVSVSQIYLIICGLCGQVW